MTNNEMMALAEQLKKAKDKKKELEAQTKETEAEIRRLDLALSDAMAEAECEKFSHQGSTFYLSSRLYASAKAGMKDDLIAALRANGYGTLVTESVNANTLSSFVKEQRELNDDVIPDWLAGIVNAYDKVSVGIRKK